MKQNRDRFFFRRELFRDRQNNLNSLFSASYDKQVLENGIKVIFTVGKSSLLSQKDPTEFLPTPSSSPASPASGEAAAPAAGGTSGGAGGGGAGD